MNRPFEEVPATTDNEECSSLKETKKSFKEMLMSGPYFDDLEPYLQRCSELPQKH